MFVDLEGIMYYFNSFRNKLKPKSETMKQTKITSILSITFFSLIVISCEFHYSVDKNLITGAFSKGDGLSVEEINLTINGVTENRTLFTYEKR